MFSRVLETQGSLLGVPSLTIRCLSRMSCLRIFLFMMIIAHRMSMHLVNLRSHLFMAFHKDMCLLRKRAINLSVITLFPSQLYQTIFKLVRPEDKGLFTQNMIMKLPTANKIPCRLTLVTTSSLKQFRSFFHRKEKLTACSRHLMLL